jgi:putative aldouronate transport system permease protein
MSLIKESKGDKIFNAANFIITSLLTLIVLYPLIYILSASISNPDLVYTGKVWLLPRGITFEGYQRVLQDPDIMTGYANTIFYTVVGTMINLAVTLTAAYSLSKKFVPGGRVVMLLMIFTMYFSGGMIPTYMIMKNLNLLDTRLIMVVSGAVSTYNLIIARTFFISGVPKEVEEAALIDGCSIFRTFISIVLPLSKAVIGVLALYYGVAHWNSYFNALIYLSDNDKYPLQLILRAILISNQQKASMALENEEMMQVQQRVANLIKYSVIVVSSLPVLVAYPFLQKYFAKGVMVGSVKG